MSEIGDPGTIGTPAPSTAHPRATRRARTRPAFLGSDLALLWRNAIRFVAAAVVAALPFVFDFDEAMDLPFSSVLRRWSSVSSCGLRRLRFGSNGARGAAPTWTSCAALGLSTCSVSL